MSNSINNHKLPKGWRWAKFDEFLLRIERKITVDDLLSYDCVGVRWYGMGAFVRENLPGINIARKQQWLIKAGDIVYNKLFAWKGAFAIADSAVDGCIVSDKFPTYQLDVTIVNPNFLHYYFHTINIAQQALALSKGGAAISKLTLNPPQFWDLVIPLPSLEKQQSIVTRIEELAAKVEEAWKPHQEALEAAEKVMAGAELEIWSDESLGKAVCLEEVTTFLARGRQSAQGDSEQYLIKTQHVQQGKYIRSHITLAPEVATKVQSDAMAQLGDILIACSAAGCLGRVARFMEADQVASTDTHVAIARANPQAILPDYLYAYLKGAQGQIQLRSRERGDWMREKVGFRLTELNLADLKRVPVPLPSPGEQQRIVAYLDELQAKVDSMHLMQATTSAHLNAMLPSILDKAFKGEL